MHWSSRERGCQSLRGGIPVNQQKIWNVFRVEKAQNWHNCEDRLFQMIDCCLTDLHCTLPLLQVSTLKLKEQWKYIFGCIVHIPQKELQCITYNLQIFAVPMCNNTGINACSWFNFKLFGTDNETSLWEANYIWNVNSKLLALFWCRPQPIYYKTLWHYWGLYVGSFQDGKKIQQPSTGSDNWSFLPKNSNTFLKCSLYPWH